MSPSNSALRDAFTLIELLIVVAIILILASLTFPTATRLIEKSRSARCIGNLRQIGVGLGLYATDHDQALPANDAWSGGPWWSWEVNPYLGVKDGWNGFNPLYLCPSSPWKDHPGDVGWNMSYAYAMCEPANGLKIPSITAPAKFFLVGEAIQQEAARSVGHILEYPRNSVPTPAGLDTDHAKGSDWAWVRFRHSGRSNFLFADFHVEAVARPDTGDQTWRQHWEN